MFLMSSFLPRVRISFIVFCKFILKLKKNDSLGLSWSAATTEGVLVYSLDSGFVFDPFHLDIGITPTTTRETLSNKEYSSGESK